LHVDLQVDIILLEIGKIEVNEHSGWGEQNLLYSTWGAAVNFSWNISFQCVIWAPSTGVCSIYWHLFEIDHSWLFYELCYSCFVDL